MNTIKDDVILLVEKELKSANEKFPLFNSPHEGYAVIKEELEETAESFEYAKTHLNYLWVSKVRENKDASENAQVIKNYMVHTAIEAIQTAAMCQKYIDSQEGFK